MMADFGSVCFSISTQDETGHGRWGKLTRGQVEVFKSTARIVHDEL